MYLDAGDSVAESTEIARRALARFDFSPRTTLRVVDRSGTVTFCVEDPVTQERAAMRLHDAGHHEILQIKSELLWIDAIRADRCVEVPPPIAARTGERVVRIDTDEDARLVTVCGWLEGTTPDPADDLVPAFATLGAATARLHRHAAAWPLPPGFCRRPWGVEQLLGSRPTLGPWRSAEGLGAQEHATLEAAEAAIRRDLAGFEAGPGHFGLVHADLRLTNLLLGTRADGSEVVRIIDFDHCGASWMMYDFGAAVSFMEDDPRVPALMAAWAEGYRTVRELSRATEAQLPTFVMLRRLVLLGWAGRDREAARRAGADGAAFTAGACELAERYLGGRFAA